MIDFTAPIFPNGDPLQKTLYGSSAKRLLNKFMQQTAEERMIQRCARGAYGWAASEEYLWLRYKDRNHGEFYFTPQIAQITKSSSSAPEELFVNIALSLTNAFLFAMDIPLRVQRVSIKGQERMFVNNPDGFGAALVRVTNPFGSFFLPATTNVDGEIMWPVDILLQADMLTTTGVND